MTLESYNPTNTSYWKLNGYKGVYCYLPVCYFPEDWTVEDLDEFEVLWTGSLKSAIPFSSAVNSYTLKLLEDSPKPKVSLLFRFLFFFLIHSNFSTCTTYTYHNCISMERYVKFKCLYKFMYQCYACWITVQNI